MTGLLICAAVVAGVGGWFGATLGGGAAMKREDALCRFFGGFGLALLAVALWLAYAAGGA